MDRNMTGPDTEQTDHGVSKVSNEKNTWLPKNFIPLEKRQALRKEYEWRNWAVINSIGLTMIMTAIPVLYFVTYGPTPLLLLSVFGFLLLIFITAYSSDLHDRYKIKLNTPEVTVIGERILIDKSEVSLRFVTISRGVKVIMLYHQTSIFSLEKNTAILYENYEDADRMINKMKKALRSKGIKVTEKSV
jgi:hypothetical protein